MQSFADHFEMLVGDQPVVFDHARSDHLEAVRQFMVVGLQEFVETICEILKGLMRVP